MKYINIDYKAEYRKYIISKINNSKFEYTELFEYMFAIMKTLEFKGDLTTLVLYATVDGEEDIIGIIKGAGELKINKSSKFYSSLKDKFNIKSSVFLFKFMVDKKFPKLKLVIT